MSQGKKGEKMAHTCIDCPILSSALLTALLQPQLFVFSGSVEESESEVSSPKQKSPESEDCECLFCSSVQQLASVCQKGGRYCCSLSSTFAHG